MQEKSDLFKKDWEKIETELGSFYRRPGSPKAKPRGEKIEKVASHLEQAKELYRNLYVNAYKHIADLRNSGLEIEDQIEKLQKFEGKINAIIEDIEKATHISPTHWYVDSKVGELVSDRLRDLQRLRLVKQQKSLSTPRRNIYTDRSFNLLIPNKEIKITGELNYKTRWIHDTISEMVWRWVDKNGVEKQSRPLMEIESAKDLINALTNINRSDLPEVSFTEADVRKITGRSDLSNVEIENLVNGYSRIHIKGVLKCFWNGAKKEFQTVELMGNLCDVIVEKTEKFTKKGHVAFHSYKIIWGAWGIVLLNNFIQHKIGKPKPKKFYRLPGGEQNLTRYVEEVKSTRRYRRKKQWKLSQRNVVLLLGRKIDVKNKVQQKIEIFRLFKQLKRKNVIKDVAVEVGKRAENVFLFRW